jgi:antitoxin (DNA-binding transcriptional repressor) of toxin-antitoxin stability system
MHFSTVVAAVAAVAPVVSAHGGAPIPKIVGLNVKDLKARDLLSSLNARIAEVGRSEVHEKRQPLEARQNTDGQCGSGFGSCAAGVCCSQSGCMKIIHVFNPQYVLTDVRVWN